MPLTQKHHGDDYRQVRPLVLQTSPPNQTLTEQSDEFRLTGFFPCE